MQTCKRRTNQHENQNSGGKRFVFFFLKWDFPFFFSSKFPIFNCHQHVTAKLSIQGNGHIRSNTQKYTFAYTEVHVSRHVSANDKQLYKLGRKERLSGSYKFYRFTLTPSSFLTFTDYHFESLNQKYNLLCILMANSAYQRSNIGTACFP